MPFYPTLTSCKELTSKFRVAYMGVAHDVLLRKMKKAALEESRRVGRENEEENLDDNEEESSPVPQLQTNMIRLDVPTEPVKVPADGQEFREFKKIKALVRAKGSNEEIRGYLKEVWHLVEGSTECEEAKRLWLGHVTSQHIDRKEPARNHYERLVLEDEDDEDAHIARARAGLDQGQTLAQGNPVRGPPGTWGQQTGAQATPPKPKPKSAAAGPRTGEHLPDEEYRKLTCQSPVGERDPRRDAMLWDMEEDSMVKRTLRSHHNKRDLKELQLPKKLRRSIETPFGQATSQSGETRTSPEQSHTNELGASIRPHHRGRSAPATGASVQYPLNPGAVEEMDKIVRELSALGIIREEPSPITNSPIQAVKKPESAGGGWRPVINFKALSTDEP
ncbi:hypothetical protein L3Q82_008807 [Scortum barcoo]|uniref:Uncharacterized protein n=1 Tax=Scortum barcoo TaxID=214431 RepID=A0ACB8XFQ5_9TELE|nr:hypothetical protein L3Q82_008807 [Scortum barcoo]